jgi:hypothetical protein
MRESFIIYKSFIDAGREIKNKVDRLNFYESIFQFALSGEEFPLEGVSKAMFMLVKPQLVANQKRYENGNKGGKPPTNPEPKPNLEVTNHEPNNNGNVNNNNNQNKSGDKSPNLTSNLESRKNKFIEDLKSFVDVYGKEMVRKFFDYWSELNKSQTKMRWELEKTFEISKRLATWASRDKTFSPKQEQDIIPHKPEKSILETYGTPTY